MSNQYYINQILNPRAANANYWNSVSSGSPFTQQPSGGPTDVNSYISSAVTNGYAVANLGTYISPDPLQRIAPPTGNYSLGIWVRVNQAGITASVFLQRFVYSPFGSGLSQERLAPVELVANTWTWLATDYTFPEQPVGTEINDFAVGVSVEKTDGSTMTGVVLDATGALFVQNLDAAAPYSGKYFDGSTPDITDEAVYEWLGATNNSPSSALLTFPEPVLFARSAPTVTPVPVVPVSGVRPRTFDPINLTDYQVQEDSTPVDPSDTTGAVGAITMMTTEQADTISLMDIPVDLTIVTQGVTRGTVRGLSSTDEEATIVADSRMAQLVVNRQAQPFTGTLGAYFEYLLELAELTDGIVIDPDLAAINIDYPGWSGSVWDYMKKVLVANRLEVSLVSNNIVVRPIRERVAENYRDMSRGWSLDSSSQARSIEIYYYQNDYRANSIAYPSGGWSPEVEIITVGAGEVVDHPISFNASLTSIQQPTVELFVSKDYVASSVYTVAGNDGLPIPPAWWTSMGGSLTVSINEDTRSATVKVTAPQSDLYAPYSIAVQSSPSDRYSTLRLVGTGVFYDKQVITLGTSVDPDVVTTEVGATIDNEFISTAEEAVHCGLWALKRWGSPKYTITVSTTGINRLGDNGSYRYPTIAEFNAIYSGDTVADFNADWSGKTIEDFNRFMVELVQNDFDNQAFGNIAGARVKFKDAWFRIRSATNGASGITYTAEEDTTVADFNEVWSGDGPAQRNFIANPSGRVNTTGYTGLGGTLTLSPGNYLQYTSSGTGASESGGISMTTYNVGTDLQPNTTYVFSADVEAVSGFSARLVASHSAAIYRSSDTSIGAGFARLTLSFTTAASGVVSLFILNASARTSGGQVRIRDLRLGDGSSYGSGDTFGWVWNGTPNASASTGPAGGTATIQDFNNTWSGYRFRDFAVAPLRRIR